MPVSTGAADTTPTTTTGSSRAKRCKHCEESGHRLDSGGLYWRIQLDQDLLDTIVAIYPEWFKDYNLGRTPSMADGSTTSSPSTDPGAQVPPSPPKVEVDESPLQRSMDKNKESLKVKLMLRRPINQLVAQGIMPPLKSPQAFHEQRQKLERAKMGDLLKAKIQQRPDRQELVRQHILEVDVGHVDPSLAERQRRLKKARLADALNDQLSHRPGPLELIKKNILHTDEPIERAVKEGVIPFKATCEGQLSRPQHPNRYITYDEDSQSSEGAQSPLQTTASTSLPETRPDAIEAAAASAGIVTVALTIPTTGGAVVVTSTTPPFQLMSSAEQPQRTAMTFVDLCNSVARSISPAPLPTTLPTILPLAPAPSPMSLGSTTSSLSPLSSISVSSPPAPPTPSPTLAITPRPLPQTSPISNRDAPGKDKNRKKSKSKSQPKTRTIKFHEYKGPPNAHKTIPMNASPVETSYEILLHQQQLFLQWQLEWQHKYPQIILPAAQKPMSVSTDGGSTTLPGLIAVSAPSNQHPVTVATATPSPSGAMSPAMMQPATPQQTQVASPAEPAQHIIRALTKLEDMKVNDLKAELKRRNLPVSGSKPQLIERLKPFTDVPHPSHDNNQTTIPVSHMGHIIMDIPGSVMSEESLSGVSNMETPVSPTNKQSNSTIDGSVTDDESLTNLSPASQQQLSPISQSMSPEGPVEVEMDTTESVVMATSSSPAGANPQSPSPGSPMQAAVGEGIIRDQQRKIKELQRELQRSQQQLQQIKSSKEGSAMLPKLKQNATSLTTLPNGIVIDAKQHQKLMLHQHLQHKIQQQQLQVQLQQLQQLQTLQQQQQQQQQAQQQQRQQQHVAFQQQQKQIQQGINAKASLAAFLQNQNQQQQISNLIQQQTTTAVNNKNNNNTTALINNKKNGTMKSIVLDQQQSAIVLKLNLQKQKTNTITSAVGHHRTASLPNFVGSFITQNQPSQQQQQHQDPQLTSTQSQPSQQQSQVEDIKPQVTRGSSEPQFLITKPPPPQYEEATKQLKIKQEVPSSCETKSRQKNVKSQIVDDVLEILIKNGELPPSAAQDPATPTTPGRSMPQGLIFTTNTTQNTNPSSPPAPPPPPPPPLPHTTFAITLPTAISLTTQAETQESPFQMQFTGAESLDFILGNVESNHTVDSTSGDSMSSHNLLSSDMTSNPAIDLKELGLDLETLDSMDFGQLDCGDLGVSSVKMEPSDLMDTMTDMEISSVVGENREERKNEGPIHDQLINQHQCELMDIGDIPMDMDDADWLDSFMPSEGQMNGGILNSTVMSNPQHNCFQLPSSMAGGLNYNSQVDNDTYDPLLSNSQDPFDLFNIEDSEFKMAGDLNTALGWDKVDFAT